MKDCDKEMMSQSWIYLRHNISPIQQNRIIGVMISVLASGAVDRGFDPWSGQTKDYKIGIGCLSAKYAA